RMRSKVLRWLALGLVFVLTLALALGIWVVPSVIVAQIRKHHRGYVTIRGWWIHWSSAGVTGRPRHGREPPGHPVWAAAERVTSDLSLGSLLRGKFSPRRLLFDHPSVSYRIEAEGDPLTVIPLQHTGGGPIPEMIARDGQLTMRQADRSEMLIAHPGGRMGPPPGRPHLEAHAGDSPPGHPPLTRPFHA